MLVYITIMILVTVFGGSYIYWSNISGEKNHNILSNKYPKYYTNLFFWLIYLTLAIPYIIRYNVGTDYYGYKLSFDGYANYSMDKILEMRDTCYYFLAWVIHNMTDGNWYILCMVLAALAYIPIIYYYRRYAYQLVFALLIYIMFTCYFVEYNAVRQGVAIAFTTLGSMFLVDKKYIRYALCMFIAYEFHATSFIFIVFSLLALIDIKNRLSTTIKAVLIFSVFALNNVWSIILDVFDTVGQDKLYQDYSAIDISTANGSGYLRLAVYLVPVILMLIFGNKVVAYFENKNDDTVPNRTKHINFWVNCTQFSAIFMFASTRYWIFARVAAYMAVFTPILISHFLVVIEKKSRIWFYLATLILFFIYMYLMAHTESDLLPFRTEFGWYFN